jgi:hypothetical protein
LWFDLNAIGSQKRAGEESKSSQWENIEQRTPINREQASNTQHPSELPARVPMRTVKRCRIVESRSPHLKRCNGRCHISVAGGAGGTIIRPDED